MFDDFLADVVYPAICAHLVLLVSVTIPFSLKITYVLIRSKGRLHERKAAPGGEYA